MFLLHIFSEWVGSRSGKEKNIKDNEAVAAGMSHGVSAATGAVPRSKLARAHDASSYESPNGNASNDQVAHATALAKPDTTSHNQVADEVAECSPDKETDHQATHEVTHALAHGAPDAVTKWQSNSSSDCFPEP